MKNEYIKMMTEIAPEKGSQILKESEEIFNKYNKDA